MVIKDRIQGVLMDRSYTYTAKYTKISRGYMGQLVEWPEVITEGSSLEECRGARCAS